MNENSRISSVIVSVFCIGIIIFILFTQMEISTIKLKLKDASLILIFIALLVYINGYEKLFLVLLGSWMHGIVQKNNCWWQICLVSLQKRTIKRGGIQTAKLFRNMRLVKKRKHKKPLTLNIYPIFYQNVLFSH